MAFDCYCIDFQNKKSKENITIKIGAEPRAIGYTFV